MQGDQASPPSLTSACSCLWVCSAKRNPASTSGFLIRSANVQSRLSAPPHRCPPRRAFPPPPRRWPPQTSRPASRGSVSECEQDEREMHGQDPQLRRFPSIWQNGYKWKPQWTTNTYGKTTTHPGMAMDSSPERHPPTLLSTSPPLQPNPLPNAPCRHPSC